MKKICHKYLTQEKDEEQKKEFQNGLTTKYQGFKVQINCVHPHYWTRKLYFKNHRAN